MFSFGRSDRPQFGGVGVMVEPPNIEVSIQPSKSFNVRGDHADRTRRFVEMASRAWRLPALPACEIEVHSPPDHTGLGVGTQLGLAVVAGLRQFTELTSLEIEKLAESIGRGQRSAVGTYGFEQGGLIVDSGLDAESLRPRLNQRMELPSAWRFVLVRPAGSRGLAGAAEVAAFARLPPVPDRVTDELSRISSSELLPAVEAADCTAFGDAVYRFGRLAGECFAASQGGPYANRHVADLVAAIRAYGVAGVGQSSWGPTVFAVRSNDDEAARLVKWLQSNELSSECEISVGKPNNFGAVIDYANAD
jgi:beta-RFAP synthase